MDLTQLFPWLQSNDVLTMQDTASIQAYRTSFRQNSHLLDLMTMKSDQQIQTFIQGLIECNQKHLVWQLEGNIIFYSVMPYYIIVLYICKIKFKQI